MSEIKKRKEYHQRVICIAFIVLILCTIISLLIGRFSLFFDSNNLSDVWNQLTSSQSMKIIWQLRLPRTLAAIIIGASLSVTGVAYQSVFGNPLASPGTLGAQNGAAFGAAIALFFSASSFMVTGASFFMGIFSVFLVYLTSRYIRGNSTLTLVLSGMLIGTLFSSGTSFLKLIADPNNTLPTITYWLMGSLSDIRFSQLGILSVINIVGIIVLLALRWQLNILTLGNDEAMTLGLNVKRTRNLILVVATFMTASCVAVSGVIGWVGLIVPHFVRWRIGGDHRYLLPNSALYGAIFLLVVDILARTITSTEIPIGILTSFIGAPLFFFIMLKGEQRV